MYWYIWWSLSVGILSVSLVTATVLALIKNQKKHFFTPNRVLFLGAFLSSCLFFVPMYHEKLLDANAFWKAVNTALLSVQHSFRLFALEGDYNEFILTFEFLDDKVELIYKVFGAVLYTYSPMLTFGFILSFFKNLYAHFKYSVMFWRHTHVFSELNDKTLTLANDILQNGKKILGIIPQNLIVFTDIVDKVQEENIELVEKAAAMGAILFRKDLEYIKFRRKKSVRELDFYLISQDEPEKIRHANHIVKQYDYDNTKLWLFSEDIRTELLMSVSEARNIRVSKVNDIQALIYHNLDSHGQGLFRHARLSDDGKMVISAVIVGMGRYGREMLKALTWYCQYPGYRLKINAFDSDPKALERFTAKCPELMSDEYNHCFADGDAGYDIYIHSGIDVSLPDFEDKLSAIKDATYIFVCLGDDKTNLFAATKIRSICERVHYIGDHRKPDIEAVIYDTNICDTVGIKWDDVLSDPPKEAGLKNYRNQRYNIIMTGDLGSFYTEETIKNSDLVTAAQNVHEKYSKPGIYFGFAEKHLGKEWIELLNAQNHPELVTQWEQYSESNPEKTQSGFIKDVIAKPLSETLLKEWKALITSRTSDWEKFIRDNRLSAEWKAYYSAEEKKMYKSFQNDYNFRSSITKALHERLRKKCGLEIPGANKPWEQRTNEEKLAIGKIEHVRWNAYMRTEGYRWSGSRNPKSRNDLASLHHDLVPTTSLSDDDLRKDM